jgi:hypothetical protein
MFVDAKERAGRDDERAALETRGAELMGVINVATAQLVQLIADAIASELWVGAGIRSPEHWVRWRFGVGGRRARSLVLMARALQSLPANAAQFAAGRLTEDQTEVICRHVDAAHDAEVAEVAPVLLVHQLKRLLATVPQPEHADADDGEEPPRVPERREVAFGWTDEGSFWARMHLPPDEGAVVEGWLTRGRDELFHAGHPEVTWSDALLHNINAACYPADGERRAGLRTMTLFHLNFDQARDLATGRVHMGPLLPDALRRLLTCDSSVRAVLEAAGVPVAMSMSGRVVDDRLRVLVEERDRGCRVPGCSQRRWLVIHHIVHWEDGGRTEITNLCALCPYHHRQHHLGALGITGDPTTIDGLQFTDSRGRLLEPGRPRPPNDLPAAEPYASPHGERLSLRWVAWR